MEQNTILTCLAMTFIPMKSLKDVAETFKVGFWILPQIIFLARDMFFGSSIFFGKCIFVILATSICKHISRNKKINNKSHVRRQRTELAFVHYIVVFR